MLSANISHNNIYMRANTSNRENCRSLPIDSYGTHTEVSIAQLSFHLASILIYYQAAP